MEDNIYSMQKELAEMYKPNNIIGISKTEARKVLNKIQPLIDLSKQYGLTNTKEYEQLIKVYDHLKKYTNNGKRNYGSYRKNSIEKAYIEESKRKYELLEKILLQMLNKDKEMVQLFSNELAKYINKDFAYKENLEKLLNNVLNNDNLDPETKQKLALNIMEIIDYIAVSNSNVKPDTVNKMPKWSGKAKDSEPEPKPEPTPEPTPKPDKENGEKNGKNGNGGKKEDSKESGEKKEGWKDKLKKAGGWIKRNIGKPFEKPPFEIEGLHYNPARDSSNTTTSE